MAFFFSGSSMHLLYLDESGSVADPNQNHFILAGLSVFERKTHWIEQELNNIAKRFDQDCPHTIPFVKKQNKKKPLF
jgi:hypothetical protein